MLNLFIDKWLYFCISHQLLTLTNRRLLRFMPKEDKNIHKSPHNLYHVKLELPLKISHSYIKWSDIFFLYPPTNEVVRGYIGFTPSVRLSVHLSVCPSVSPTSRIRSVAPTVLVGSISYLYTCQATSEGVPHVKFPAKFKNLNIWQFFKICSFDFVLFWLRIWQHPHFSFLNAPGAGLLNSFAVVIHVKYESDSYDLK